MVTVKHSAYERHAVSEVPFREDRDVETVIGKPFVMHQCESVPVRQLAE